MKKLRNAPTLTDHAVKAKTSKTWAEWFKTLDAAGARRMRHKEIVKHLGARFLLPRWWQQMITTAYEQARSQSSPAARPPRPAGRPSAHRKTKTS
jgi:hypothetical protein